MQSVGKRLSDGIELLEHPLIDRVRGAGLLLGIVLTEDLSAQVEARARAAGYLVNPAKPDVIRLAPPLVLTETQADNFVADLPGILDGALADAKEVAAQ